MVLSVPCCFLTFCCFHYHKQTLAVLLTLLAALWLVCTVVLLFFLDPSMFSPVCYSYVDLIWLHFYDVWMCMWTMPRAPVRESHAQYFCLV